MWSETECKIPAEYGLHSTVPPPSDTHCLYILSMQLGKGGGVRENGEGQQYASKVPSSMGATVHKLGRKYQPLVNVSPVYKIC